MSDKQKHNVAAEAFRAMDRGQRILLRPNA